MENDTCRTNLSHIQTDVKDSTVTASVTVHGIVLQNVLRTYAPVDNVVHVKSETGVTKEIVFL
jgi:hypothetical protein